MSEFLDRIRGALIGLRMPHALEALDHTLSQLERGEITAIEAIAGLLGEEYATRETRRIDVALRTAKLMPIKTLESFDFSFQPSLDRDRIAALAKLDFIRRAEVVHFLGPPRHRQIPHRDRPRCRRGEGRADGLPGDPGRAGRLDLPRPPAAFVIQWVGR
jgi:hypothetical protein